MRIFLDTNVLVSAFTTRGLCEDVLREVLSSHDLIVSVQLFEELERTLIGKFGMPSALVSDIVALVKEAGIFAEVSELPDVRISDQDDLGILSSALNGRAEAFVTGDKELIHLRKVRDLDILSPRAFWTTLKKA
jgi:uncharacterized protein